MYETTKSMTPSPQLVQQVRKDSQIPLMLAELGAVIASMEKSIAMLEERLQNVMDQPSTSKEEAQKYPEAKCAIAGQLRDILLRVAGFDADIKSIVSRLEV